MALQRGNQRELLTFSASFDPETPFVYEFAGLAVKMTAIKKLSDGAQMATFVVTTSSGQEDDPNETTQSVERLDRCPDFSRFDAAAILQEDVQPDGVAHLQFYPQSDVIKDVHRLCGYVGANNIPYPATEAPHIHLLSPVDAERGIVAARLTPREIAEVVPFAQNVLLANPQSRESDIYKLAANLAVGLNEEVISFFNDRPGCRRAVSKLRCGRC